MKTLEGPVLSHDAKPLCLSDFRPLQQVPHRSGSAVVCLGTSRPAVQITINIPLPLFWQLLHQTTQFCSSICLSTESYTYHFYSYPTCSITVPFVTRSQAPLISRTDKQDHKDGW